MRDRWFGDNRDLIKWGGIKILCKDKGINRVLWVAYLREDKWSDIIFDDHPNPIPLPREVVHCFKSIRENMVRLCDTMDLDIILMDDPNKAYSHINRAAYTELICSKIKNNAEGNKVVFLDPDTGLEPQRIEETHVSKEEVKSIWDSLKDGDYLVFYQHRFFDAKWRQIRQKDLSDALELSQEKIKMWFADETVKDDVAKLAKDVVFYFVEKR